MNQDWRTVPCRIWTGAKKEGYGQRWSASKGSGDLVHRMAWTAANGPIPARMFVLHHCDVRACYEVRHLFLGTHADNMADMVAKGRGRNHGGFPGERNPAAKLTHDAVQEIRRAYRVGGRSQEAIGRDFGIGQSQVSAIIRGRSWVEGR